MAIHRDSAGSWVYDYAIANHPSSAGSIDLFGITPVRNVRSITAPEHWTAFDGYQGDSLGVVWGVADDIEGRPDDGVSVSESYYNIFPRSWLVGMSIRSPLAPGPTRLLAQAYRPLPVVTDDDPEPPDPRLWEAPNGSAALEGPDSASDGRRRAMPAVRLVVWLPEREYVSIVVRDVTAFVDDTLAVGWIDSGKHSYDWAPRGSTLVAPRRYFYSLEAGGRIILEGSLGDR